MSVPSYAPANAIAALTTPTYDGSGQAIHPDVYDSGAGQTWNGYRYWMAFTPFPGGDSSFENPSILASNDLETWVVPNGLTNPIEADPGGADYNSDPELVVAGGTMYCYFRQTIGANCTLYYRSSTDGVTWSDKVSVLTGTSIQLVSPTIIYDGSQYVMWYGDQTGGTKLYRVTSPNPTGPWTGATLCGLSIPTGHNYYHFNAHYESGLYYMFVTSSPADNTDPLWLAMSNTGLNWTTGQIPILEVGDVGAWDEVQLYRSAPIRTATGFVVIYSGKSNTPAQWHLGKTSFDL